MRKKTKRLINQLGQLRTWHHDGGDTGAGARMVKSSSKKGRKKLATLLRKERKIYGGKATRNNVKKYGAGLWTA